MLFIFGFIKFAYLFISCSSLLTRQLKLRRSVATSGVKHSIIVSEDVQKERIDSYLAAQSKDLSRSAFGVLCDSGKVLINDKPVKKNARVAAGDKVDFEVEPKAESSVRPEDIPLSILYEDEHLIVVNKVAGMVVHPAPGSPNGTFVNALLYHLGDAAAKLLLENRSISDLADMIYDEDGDEDSAFMDLPETPEAANASPPSLRPGIVHRLDKGTSGVLIAAKTTEAVAKVSALFAQRKVRKVYLAVCVGHPGETTIVEPIGRSTKNRQVMTVYDGPPGKPAVTHVRTLSFDGKVSTVLARIETGRTHQIRVHLKHRRTPILGDETYGNIDWNKKYNRETRTWESVERPLLHAYETEFVHPFTGANVIVRAPVPIDMRTLIQKSSGSEELIGDDGILLCSTEVKGRSLGSEDRRKGYVPSDRLVFEEAEWTQVNLLEKPLETHSSTTRLNQRGKW